MLRRKAYDRMLEWKKSPSHTALLVTGARQVGKTYLVREFARREYRNFVELNLIMTPDACEAIERARNARDLLMRLSLLTDEPLIPHETLVFIDEVQECSEMITAIKFLVDEGSFDYVLSGSLLGVELRDIRSVPVGYLDTLEMFPLDFEEFCWAQNVSDEVFSSVRERVEGLAPIEDLIHKRLLDEFRRYVVVGGMPDAVCTYREGIDFAQVRTVQQNIKLLYRRDISKYAPKERRLAIKEIFDLVPSELSNPNKRFILKRLNENARFRSYQNDFSWLIEADVALAAYNASEPCSPLLASKERNLFKLFYSDVGLLTSSFTRRTALELLNGGNGGSYGSVYENAVAQELAAHGFDLYYYNGKKRGEVDFVVENQDGVVVPIEVKSGKDYARHRALSNILEVGNYHLSRGYVLGPCNVSLEGRVAYLPVYCAGFFESE